MSTTTRPPRSGGPDTAGIRRRASGRRAVGVCLAGRLGVRRHRVDGGVGEPCPLEQLVDVLDVVLDAVEHEGERRGVPHLGLPADLGAQDAAGALDGRGAVGSRGLVAEHRVEDGRLAQVTGHAGVGDGDEPEPRVLHLPLERLGYDDLDPVGQLAGPGVVNHLRVTSLLVLLVVVQLVDVLVLTDVWVLIEV